MNPNTILTMNAQKPNFSAEEVLNVLKYRYATKKFDPNAKISKETFDAIDVTFGSAYLDHVLKEIHQIPDKVYEFFREAYTNFSTKDFNTMESERAAFDWSAKQAYIVMANMMTAAAFFGVDSCAIEGFQPKELDRILGAEEKLYDTEHYSAAVTLALGYRNETPHRDKTRRPLTESVIWK